MVEECTAQTITGVPTLPPLHGFSTHTCLCLAALPGSQGPAGGGQHIRGWAPERGAGPGAGACGSRPGWASRPRLGAAHQLWEQACPHPPTCWPWPTTALWTGCSLRGEPWGPSGLGWRLSLPRRGHRNLPPPPPLCGAHWPSHSGLLQTVVIVGVFSSTSKEASPPGGTWAGAGDEPWGDWRGGEQEGSGIASGGSGPSPNPRLG